MKRNAVDQEKCISVIIPVYNGEKYIAQAIENILFQSYKNLEIIVVDDQSTDNTRAIAQRYSSKIKLVVNDQNRGASFARNVGFDMAQGEYIHFHDADDLINQQYYEKMMETLGETDAEIAVSSMVNEARDHRTILYKDKLVVLATEDKLSMTKVGRYGYVWRYVFRKSFLNRHQLRFIEGRYIQDLLFSLPAIFFAEKIVLVPDAIYYYKRRAESSLHTKNREIKRKRHEDWKYAKEFRREFAVKHNVKIPGIATKSIGAWIVKWFS